MAARDTVLGAALALVLAAWAGPAAASSPFEAATEAFRAGRYEEFLSIMGRIAAASPGNPALEFQIARGEAKLGRAEAALARLKALAEAGAAPDLAHADLTPLRALPGHAEVAALAARNAGPLGQAIPMFRTAQGRAAEGIAFDAATGTIYLGNMAGGDLLLRGPDGTETVWPFPADLGVRATLGLRADPGGRALWACATVEREGKRRQALLELSLDPLAVRRSLDFPGDGPHLCNDVALAGGRVLVTDSEGGAVWAVQDGALVPLVPGGTLIYPNGIAPAPGGTHAYVAHFGGLSRLDPATGTLTPLRLPGAILTGIDGLQPLPDGLLAVQNTFRPARLVRLRLDREGGVAAVTPLVSGRPEMEEPTTVALNGAGDAALLIANAQIDKAEQDPVPPLDPALVLWVPLK